jgi:hypothetical protein
MPTVSLVAARTVSPEEFALLDYRVMRHAFDSHSELGRLCDEQVYRHDLAARLASADLGTVRTEVPLTVTHRCANCVYFLVPHFLVLNLRGGPRNFPA